MTWDLTSYFAEFNGAEMLQFKQAIRADVAALQQTAASLPVLSSASASAWEYILLRNEDVSRRMSHLGSYISCLASSDARNEAYLKEEAELTRSRAELAKVRIEFLRAFKDSSDGDFAALGHDRFARIDHDFGARKSRAVDLAQIWPMGADGIDVDAGL